MGEREDNEAAPHGTDEQNIDQLLQEREKLEHMFKDKFTKVITVMFTDLKGSTALADKQGDLVSRTLVKHYQDIIIPAVKEHNGVFIKTIGDGTLSYFDNAQDALRAAVQLQRGIDDFIVREKSKTPILARVGMHTGRCIIEKNDIFGDVVNTASRFESNADPGGIALSEDTYNALIDKNETVCRHVKTQTLKGKADAFKIYKAYWNPSEIEQPVQTAAAAQQDSAIVQPKPLKKIAIIVAVILILFLLLTQGRRFLDSMQSSSERRSIQETTETAPAASPGRQAK